MKNEVFGLKKTRELLFTHLKVRPQASLVRVWVYAYVDPQLVTSNYKGLLGEISTPLLNEQDRKVWVSLVGWN